MTTSLSRGAQAETEVSSSRSRSLSAAIALSLAAAFPAHADPGLAPDAMARTVTAGVLSILKSDAQAQHVDSAEATRLIESKIVPHFDFGTMTRLAVGPDWRKATPAQRKELTEQFQALLVRVYATLLAQYHGETIRYQRLRVAPDATDAVVRSRISHPGEAPIEIDYSMEKTANGWKVYNLSIEGVGLVENYRNQFGVSIRTGGIDALIHTLAAKNKGMA
jgi:phospholipid transport system substrate-binding protein